MKNPKSMFFRICILAGFVLVAQGLFAKGIIIRKDGVPDPPPPQMDRIVVGGSPEYDMVTDEITDGEFPVSASVDSSTLSVCFDWPVGDATIRVYDATNQLVYEQTVDTYLYPGTDIPIGNWAYGDYTLKISYGTTHLTGDFSL